MRCSIFEIGLGRNGSRSICRAVKLLGLKTRHGFDNKFELRQDAVKKFLSGSYRFNLYNDCDYCGDIPVIHWKTLFENEPNAKFVLPIRPIDSWISSLLHADTSISNKKLEDIFNEGTVNWRHIFRLHCFGTIRYEVDLIKQKYIEHTIEVTNTITDDRLLVLDIFSMKSKVVWQKLCWFLKTDVPDIEFPHVGKGGRA